MSGSLDFTHAPARLLLSGICYIDEMDQDEPARVGGGDQEMKVLSEINEMQAFENGNWRTVDGT